MSSPSANKLIQKLNLKPHPEGGFYRRTYTSEFTRQSPSNNSPKQPIMTGIYYLLTSEEHSRFHQLQSDEVWHFYRGDPLKLHLLDQSRGHIQKTLSANIESGHKPQISIPSNTWFAATVTGEFSLAGCSVAPGFRYEEFELGDTEELRSDFPDHRDVIEQFT